ncbi:hypothetical protein DENIT_60406 [Pseudomonas veronii]|nr:hypothetical protein DENIT_60406 [Pseudomonas veronii]
MGGGLPPMAVCQPIHAWLIHCHRGQAPSHIFDRVRLAESGRLQGRFAFDLRHTGPSFGYF